MERLTWFFCDLWETWWVRVIAIILLVIGVVALLYFALPVIAQTYLALFIISWNESVAQIFNLPQITSGQANALCMLSALILVPLFVLASLFGGQKPKK